MENKTRKICNTILAVGAGIALSTGVVFAGTKVYQKYEKIWKEPNIITQEEKEKYAEEITRPFSDEEKATMISEEKAIQIGKNILNTLGYGELNFEKINTVRGNDGNFFILCTKSNVNKGITVTINASNGEFRGLSDNTILEKELICDDISEEDAKEIANNLYSKLNIFNGDEKYEIVSVKKSKFASGTNVNDMWQVSYAKIFDDNNYDKNSTFGAVFSVVNGKTIIHNITGIIESNFENNPVVISKDEAIKIAVDKEKSFSSLEISEVNAELSVEKMNIFIYCLENNITNFDGKYQVDDITRNVWVVEIKHKKDYRVRESDLQTVKEKYNKKYFVDASTGEIIGGEQAELFQK